MPTRAPSRCNVIDCSAWSVKRGRCADHQPTPWERPSQHAQQVDTTKWRRCRYAQLDRAPWCEKCGAVEHLEVDHIVPIADGGALYSSENLQTLCHRCHGVKTATENAERRRRQTAARRAAGV